MYHVCESLYGKPCRIFGFLFFGRDSKKKLLVRFFIRQKIWIVKWRNSWQPQNNQWKTIIAHPHRNMSNFQEKNSMQNLIWKTLRHLPDGTTGFGLKSNEAWHDPPDQIAMSEFPMFNFKYIHTWHCLCFCFRLETSLGAPEA